MKETILRAIWKLTGRRSSVDTFFTQLLKHRHYLPVADPQDCIPRFHEAEVRIRSCPMGLWSTPVVDVLVLIKAALGFEARTILELGSYRGDTARLLAENTADHVRIVTVDSYPEHGEAYRGLALGERIGRRVGRISPALFNPEERFDLIFVDADHDYRSVKNDSAVARQVLAPGGVILWHDYHHQSYFHGMAGVPEALHELQKEIPIVALAGTRLAMHCARSDWTTHLSKASTSTANVWQDTGFKG